jgi:hypothetical protein
MRQSIFGKQRKEPLESKEITPKELASITQELKVFKVFKSKQFFLGLVERDI